MSMEICEKCGLPKDLCVCGEISKRSQVIKVSTSTRKYGKPITIVDGIDEEREDLNGLIKDLKSKCACGGTIKSGKIELQGNHKEMVKRILEESGYHVM